MERDELKLYRQQSIGMSVLFFGVILFSLVFIKAIQSTEKYAEANTSLIGGEIVSVTFADSK